MNATRTRTRPDPPCNDNGNDGNAVTMAERKSQSKKIRSPFRLNSKLGFLTVVPWVAACATIFISMNILPDPSVFVIGNSVVTIPQDRAAISRIMDEPDIDKSLMAMPNANLIIATVPYDRYHAKALWSHLECLTENINHVVIAAPDADWSRSIVDAIVTKFQAALKNRSISNSKTITIGADYFVNDRYDVGLWCDALKSRSDTVPRTRKQATFLVNDSAFSVRKYVELTDRIVNASKHENSFAVNNQSLKLLSLNGGLDPNWVESVYRGFTPQGLQTFFNHSCAHRVMKCSKKKAPIIKKQCVVDYHEKALSQAYQMFEARSMYPSFYPTEVDEIKYWEKEGLNLTRQQSDLRGDDHWIHGRKYYQHLLTEFNFPLVKVKATIQGAPGTRGVNPETKGLNLQCFNTVDDSFFDSLRYPSKEEMG